MLILLQKVINRKIYIPNTGKYKYKAKKDIIIITCIVIQQMIYKKMSGKCYCDDVPAVGTGSEIDLSRSILDT